MKKEALEFLLRQIGKSMPKNISEEAFSRALGVADKGIDTLREVSKRTAAQQLRDNLGDVGAVAGKLAFLGGGGLLAGGVLSNYNELDRRVGGLLPFGVTPEQLRQETENKTDVRQDPAPTGTGGDEPKPPWTETPYVQQINKALTQYLDTEARNRARSLDQTDYILSPGFRQAETNRLVGGKQKLNRQIIESIERRTAEKSRRDESIARINSWKEIEKATIEANTRIAQSLGQIAYQSGLPNAGVLQANSGALQASANAFGTGQSLY